MSEIIFKREELAKFLELCGDESGDIYIIEGDNIVAKWTSYINGVWKDHKDIVVKGRKMMTE